uniref:Satellite RNA 48 kDa protein n=1 Tax=Tomato black ring virus (strain L) TaxID=12278 RepID=VS48_TBRVL|nr:RecName: Full=Satellite RNA 48 kDa protein [Tomato black ring virus (STRAIN L)]CAB59632.1 48 kDa protein [Tomato black ring virus satellite RNA]
MKSYFCVTPTGCLKTHTRPRIVPKHSKKCLRTYSRPRSSLSDSEGWCVVLPRDGGGRKRKADGSQGRPSNNPGRPSRKWTEKTIAAPPQGFFSRRDNGYWVPKSPEKKYVPKNLPRNMDGKKTYKDALTSPAKIQIKPTPESILLAQKIQNSTFKSRGKVTLSQTSLPLVNRFQELQLNTLLEPVEESTPFGVNDKRAQHLFCKKVERKVGRTTMLVCPITGTESHIDVKRGISARIVDSMASVVHTDKLPEYERGHVVIKNVSRTKRVCTPVPFIGTFSDRAIRVECDDHTDELASASSVPSIWKPSKKQHAVPISSSNEMGSAVGTKPDWYTPVKTCTHRQYQKVQRVFLDAMNIMRTLRFHIGPRELRETWVKCWLQVHKKNVAFPGWMITPLLSGTVPCAQEFFLPLAGENRGFVTVCQA